MPFSQLRHSVISRIERWLAFPARRPGIAIGIAIVVLAFALAGVLRIQANTSLQTMFPRGNPSADALVRVLDGFPFSGELILLASVPDGQEAAPEKLLAFADRFEKAVAASPEASKLTAGIAYRPDPDYRKFIQEVLSPAGLYYLDDATFARARQRLTSEGIQQQIKQNETMISQPGPAAGAAASWLLKDPLRLIDFIKDRFASRQFQTWQGREEFISPDGRAMLIRITGTQSSSDLEYCAALMKAVTATATGANTDGITLDYIGAYAAADYSHHQIRHDSIVSIITSVALLQILFLIFYRRPFRQFMLEIFPVLIGIFVGFGIYGWVRGSLSPIAAVIGGILAGLGVDYSVMYLASYFRHIRDGKTPAEAVRLTGVQTAKAVFAASVCVTIGFTAIAFSSVGTLRDFALLGSLGLASAFLTVIWLLPAVVSLWDTRRLAKSDTPAARRMPFRFTVEHLLEKVDRRRKALLALSLALFVICIVTAATRPGGPLPMESDLHVMHPQPNPPLAAANKITRHFGASPGDLLVHLKADSPTALLNLCHEVDRRLSTAQVQSAGVAGTMGLATFLPEPSLVERRRGSISQAEIDKVVADFKAAIEDSLFDPKSYEKYAEALPKILSAQNAPGISDLQRYPALARTMLPASAIAPGTTAAESISLVFVKTPTEDRLTREHLVNTTRSALAGLPGVTLTGLPVISMDTEGAIQQDLPRLLSIALVLVAIYLSIHFKSPGRMLLALTPTFFSLVVLAAVARLLDLKLNLVNIISLPLLIGINVDYGIYLVSLAGRRHSGQDAADELNSRPLVMRIGASAQAVVVCAASSGLGFGSLVTVSVPAVQSLGMAVAIGVSACVFGTFCLLAPILMMLERRQKTDM